MEQRALAAALVSILLVATTALGATFEGGGGIGGGGSGGVQATATRGNGFRVPLLVVQAQTVGQDYLLQSSNLTVLPSYMYVPLAGLNLVLTEVQPPSEFRLGRTPTYYLVTNSSGFSEIRLPVGNYSVQATGSVFNYTGSVMLLTNVTTYLGLTVSPAFNRVESAVVINQDTISSIEPTATIFMDIQGPFSYVPEAPCQLVGAGRSAQGENLTVNGVLSGEYPAEGGHWVLMSPKGALQDIPAEGMLLLRYSVQSSVSYTFSNSTVIYHVILPSS